MTIFGRIGSRLAQLGTGDRDEASVRVVRLHGEIDACTAPRLSHDLRREVEARPALVAIDLSDVEFLGVAGLNALLDAQQLADEGGTAILLVGSPAPAVERLLGLVGWTVTPNPVNRGRDDHHRARWATSPRRGEPGS